MFLSVAHSASQFPACFLISHAATGRCRPAWLRNTLFPAAADLHGLEIHYFRSPQTCMAPKYTISGRRRFAWPRNTLFLAVADLHGSEIHYFGLSQTCIAPKYTISGRRRFCNARNTLFPPLPCPPKNGKAATRHSVGAVAFQRKW